MDSFQSTVFSFGGGRKTYHRGHGEHRGKRRRKEGKKERRKKEREKRERRRKEKDRASNAETQRARGKEDRSWKG